MTMLTMLLHAHMPTPAPLASSGSGSGSGDANMSTMSNIRQLLSDLEYVSALQGLQATMYNQYAGQCTTTTGTTGATTSGGYSSLDYYLLSDIISHCC